MNVILQPHSKGQRHQRSSREYADMSGMSESTRHPYPAHQPFINDSNRRYADKLSEGYPENNRQGNFDSYRQKNPYFKKYGLV